MKAVESSRVLTLVEQITNRIFASGRITRTDERILRRMILTETQLTDGEMQRINRVMDRLKMGLLRISD